MSSIPPILITKQLSHAIHLVRVRVRACARGLLEYERLWLNDTCAEKGIDHEKYTSTKEDEIRKNNLEKNEEGRRGSTNSIANLRVATAKIGRIAKQITKQTKAATLHAPKTSSRSHRLTIVQISRQ